MADNEVRKYSEPKKIEKVIDGEVKTKEKGLGGKLADTFLSEDSSKIKSYILYDVIIPAIKDTIVDIVKNGIEMLFYGQTKASNISRKSANGTYVSYNSYYSPAPKRRAEPSQQRKGDIKEFIFAERGEAEKVLDTLTDIIVEYKAASVADLCSLVGVTGEWTDNKWGWVDLSDSSVKRVHGGYALDLPKPIYLE